MHPILFEIPGLDLPFRSFGLMVAIGFLVGSWLVGKLAARYGDDPKADPERFSRVTRVDRRRRDRRRAPHVRDRRDPARLADGPGFPRRSAHHPLRLEGRARHVRRPDRRVRRSACGPRRREGLRPFHALDLGLVAGFVGQAIGRVGCLLVGDDYGSVVPEALEWLPFPITLRVPDPLPARRACSARRTPASCSSRRSR